MNGLVMPFIENKKLIEALNIAVAIAFVIGLFILRISVKEYKMTVDPKLPHSIYIFCVVFTLIAAEFCGSLLASWWTMDDDAPMESLLLAFGKFSGFVLIPSLLIVLSFLSLI
jgi:hypothetical protein